MLLAAPRRDALGGQVANDARLRETFFAGAAKA